MRKDFDHPPRHMIDPALGKPATTLWQVSERRHDRCRLEVQPLTGRSHQIRLHLATIGHPILGDNLYAHPEALAMASRLQLHAERLSLSSPQRRSADGLDPCPVHSRPCDKSIGRRAMIELLGETESRPSSHALSLMVNSFAKSAQAAVCWWPSPRVIAVGVMCFIYMKSAFYNLNLAKSRYYTQGRMADFSG